MIMKQDRFSQVDKTRLIEIGKQIDIWTQQDTHTPKRRSTHSATIHLQHQQQHPQHKVILPECDNKHNDKNNQDTKYTRNKATQQTQKQQQITSYDQWLQQQEQKKQQTRQ